MFGVNSAGKSSVLHSMHFMRSVLEHHNLDPSGSPFAADDIDLGGFLNLLHKHEVGRRMVLGYSIDLSTIDLPEYGTTTEFSISERVRSAYVEFAFGLDNQDRSPRIEYYLVNLNDQDVALVLPDEVNIANGEIRSAFINLRHPLLDSVAQSPGTAEDPAANAPLVLRKLIPTSQLEDAQRQRSDHLENSPSATELEEYQAQRGHRDLLAYTLSGFVNGIPRWGKLVTHFTDDDQQGEPDSDDTRVLTRQVLSELTTGPLEVLRNLLSAGRAVGPLRSIPPRRLALDGHPKETDWYSGLAAWQRLLECSDAHLQEISQWLSDSDRLSTGYGLDRIVARELPEEVLRSLVTGNRMPADLDIETFPMTKRVLLTDSLNRVKVTPHDVGVGLSQLIPVVVAALDRSSDLLLVEQPELHIHPRVQVGLGDLFLRAACEYGKNVLIETHSEAMLLRMMKRIRQTQDGEMPAGLTPAKHSDITICLLQNEGQGVTLTLMRLNRRGEFIKAWPKGLFEESLRETF
ncbi:AAA family ATPase [Ramlibacter terrae]|uniref:AAA family ATPase n=1 Tax=Ramlibacter terrae TaxID=2732511 RepID=A0ABX6P550_9BURK|nr:AAA family ATPase [Ramlibacter terrae]